MLAADEKISISPVVLAEVPLPAVVRSSVALSDEELLIFSQRNSPYRVERNAKGELEIMTPVGGSGSRAESYVIRELDIWAEKNGGVSFSSNGGFSLRDGSMLSPDAAWVSQERWDNLSDAQRQSFPPLCPDFVIEVMSASHSRTVLQAKMKAWLDNGALLAWLIDPRSETVAVYRPGKEIEVLQKPDFVDAGQPVSAFRLRTSRLWQFQSV